MNQAPHETPEVLLPASAFTPQMLFLTSFALAILGLVGMHLYFCSFEQAIHVHQLVSSSAGEVRVRSKLVSSYSARLTPAKRHS